MNTFVYLLVAVNCAMVGASNDAKRLIDDLMSSYNSLIRPVANNSDTLIVKMALKLSQLVDVVSCRHNHCPVTLVLAPHQNLKYQIMTTNLWVEQEWWDYKLRWDPEEYGGVDTVYVPAEQIWLVRTHTHICTD